MVYLFRILSLLRGIELEWFAGPVRKRWQSIGSNLTPFTTKLLTQSFAIILYPSNKINRLLLMALTTSQCLHIFISLDLHGSSLCLSANTVIPDYRHAY